MNIAERLDACVSERVLVFGSPPPSGRDLDLLARARALADLSSELTSAGFERDRSEWVLFERCSVAAVDLVAAEEWRLPASEIEALFEEALPIHGFGNLVRPSPHHALLILARRMVDLPGLDEKKTRRVREALREDPGAWDAASARSDAWRARKALALLDRSYRTGIPPDRRQRAGAFGERAAEAGEAGPKALARGWRRTATKRRRLGVITFSGVDGSGKTSQAEALGESLVVLGYDAVIVWTKLTRNPSLRILGTPVKAALRLLRRAKPSGPAEADRPVDPGKELRGRSALITSIWTSIVALANGLTQRRIVSYHLRRGRVVLCDRYILDSAVHLRYRYGHERSLRLQSWIVEKLSPRPLLSYLLDVPPEEALARKQEQYDIAQLTLLSELYRQEQIRLGVVRLDGRRPRDELCRQIATQTWRLLSQGARTEGDR